MIVTTPKIIAYLSPMCPWTRGVVHFLQSNKYEFDYRDVSRDADAFKEMVTKSGQYSSPCVEIDGHMLADVGGDEVEAWMRQQGHIQ
jgi:glutaredoxin